MRLCELTIVVAILHCIRWETCCSDYNRGWGGGLIPRGRRSSASGGGGGGRGEEGLNRGIPIVVPFSLEPRIFLLFCFVLNVGGGLTEGCFFF